MTRAALLRLAESFFRRWPLYILLLVVTLAMGIYTASKTIDEYSSVGAVFVDSETLVASQSGVGTGGFLTYLTPAQFTSQELDGLISTEQFLDAASQRAGIELDDSPAIRASQLEELRIAVDSKATTENLVSVYVTADDPALANRLANAVIEEFVQFQINVDVAESGASEAFFNELVGDYEAELTEATAAVDAALARTNPEVDLTPQQQRVITRLEEAEDLADERYRKAVGDVDASRLAALQAETVVRQTYTVVDPPTLPVKPNNSLMNDLMGIAVFGLMGGLLALVGPIVSAILTRNVLFPADLDLGPDTEVIAILPKVKRHALSLDKVVVPPGDSSSGTSMALGNRTITFLPESDGGGAADPRMRANASEQRSVPAAAPPVAEKPEPPDRSPVEVATEPPHHDESPAEVTARQSVHPPGPQSDGAPADDTPADDTPADDTAAEDTATDDTAADDTATNGAPTPGPGHMTDSVEDLPDGYRLVPASPEAPRPPGSPEPALPDHVQELLATTEFQGSPPPAPTLPGPPHRQGPAPAQSRGQHDA